MSFSTSLIVCAVFAGAVLTNAHGFGGRGGPRGPPPPPYLRNVTEEGRRAYFNISENRNLTLAEISSQTAAWAQTYGVSSQYTEFQANQTAQRTQLTQNVTSVISQLSAAQTALEAVLNNQNQTRAEQEQAVENLRTQYPQEIPTLFFISGQFNRRGGPGGPPGGQGGRRGGPGGFGGSQGGFGGSQGGFGGSQGGFGGSQGGFGGSQGGFGGPQGGFGGSQSFRGSQNGFGGLGRRGGNDQNDFF